MPTFAQVGSFLNSDQDILSPVSLFRPSSHHHQMLHFVSLLSNSMSWPDGGQEERTGEGRAGEGKGGERREMGGKRGGLTYLHETYVEECSLWHCL